MINQKLHVAIIMDGNSRWAKLHNVSQKEGHIKGANNLKNLLILKKTNYLNKLKF